MTEKSRALPQFMYMDPATVVERIDAKRPVKPKRGEPQKRKRNYGLVSDATRTLIKRMRIREFMKGVKC